MSGYLNKDTSKAVFEQFKDDAKYLEGSFVSPAAFTRIDLEDAKGLCQLVVERLDMYADLCAFTMVGDKQFRVIAEDVLLATLNLARELENHLARLEHKLKSIS